MLDHDKKIRLQELSHKWLTGTLSKSEQSEFDQWFAEVSDAPLQIPETLALTEDAHERALFRSIQRKIKASKKRKLYLSGWSKVSAAAAILLVAGAALYFYLLTMQLPDQATRFAQGVPAGMNKATLILANGSRISLTDVANGNIAEQSGIKISKTESGQLIYTLAENTPDKEVLYNTLSVPRGGQFQLNLPDGSKIWLNADSKLTYPTSFAGQKERKVKLEGEAYFAIAKDKIHPFKVRTAQQEVEVLGTHFNISSYPEDGTTQTTLLEGSVKLSLLQGDKKAELLLKPGQQASLNTSGFKLNPNPDLEEITAWKEGYFKFNENLESIMTKVSRWYNVEVVYQTKPDPNLAFGAEISRTRNVSALLKIIESTGSVHFKIEGRRITVL